MNIQIHPINQVFPMLPDNEMKAFVHDIKMNGLRNPIVMKGGVLIDGKIRLEACRIAGIEPRFRELETDDAEAYIWSANMLRQNLTYGQRMAGHALLSSDDDGLDATDKAEVKNYRMMESYLPGRAAMVAKMTTGPLDAKDELKKTIAERKKREANLAMLEKKAPALYRMLDDDFTLEMALSALRTKGRRRHK